MTSRDIKNGTVRLVDLSPALQRRLATLRENDRYFSEMQIATTSEVWELERAFCLSGAGDVQGDPDCALRYEGSE